MSASRRVAATAARQYGLVTARQLLDAGVERHRISAWTRADRLHHVHRAVYAVGHRALSPQAHLLAAVLAIGPDAAVSHRSAGRLWGFLSERIDVRRLPVDVIVRRRLPRRPGIRLHLAATLDRRDLMRWDRIPITTPARTLLDLAAILPERALRRAVRQAEVERLVVQHDLALQLDRAPTRHPGTRRLAGIVAPGPAPTRSELEDRLLDLLQRHGFPRPLINQRVRVAGGMVEVDFLFADLRLVLETDGDRFHGTRLAREADTARQAKLEAAGYRVVRLSWRQVTGEPRQTVSRLRRIFEDQAMASAHS